MFTRGGRLIAMLVVVVTMGMSAVNASAQEVSNLMPFRSFMNTANKNLSVSNSSWAPAFKSTTVTCPASHAPGCTIRVQVSSQFTMRCCTVGDFVIKLAIPGPGSQIWPNHVVNVGMGGGMMGFGESFAHTFRWMKSGIPAGARETVSIQFRTDAGVGTAGYRIETIDSYLN